MGEAACTAGGAVGGRRRKPAPAALGPHHPGRILRRHVARRLLQPLLVSLVAFLAVLVLADLVSFADLVVNRGFGAEMVGRILLFRLAPLLGQGIPLAAMTAVLATVGRMASDCELRAWEACGLSPLGLVRPVVLFLLLPTAVGLGMTVELGPRANRALTASLLEAAREQPGATLESGSVAVFGEWRLHAREVSPDGEQLREAVAWRPGRGEMVFANRATLVRLDGKPAQVLLEQGLVLIGEGSSISQLRFDRMVQDLRSLEPRVDAVEALDAASTWTLLEQARHGATRSEEAPWSPRDARAEVHRRLALPFATLLLGLLALPLALSQRTRSRSTALLAGFASIVLYYALVQLGDGLLRLEPIPVAAAIWLPNALLLVAVLAGLRSLARGPGGRRKRRRARGLRGSGAPRTAARPLGHRWMLDRFVSARFFELALLALGGLLLAVLLVDVLDNFKWFTKYGSTPAEVLTYYRARIPVLASRTLPMALLLAAALTMSSLVASGELLAMRACGIAPLRTLAPILAACIAIAALHYQLAGEWVPRASALASQIKQTEIKDRTQVRRAVWHRDADSLYAIAWLDPLRGVARDVTLFALGPDGLPRSRVHAPAARHIGDGVWELTAPVRHAVGPVRAELQEADRYVELGEDVPSEVDTEDLSLDALQEEIHQARADGYDARRFRVDLQLRRATPVAGVVLPLLVLLFAASGPPFPGTGGILLWAFGVALVHALARAVGGALGYAATISPLLAAWAPPGILLLGGVWLGRSLGPRVGSRRRA